MGLVDAWERFGEVDRKRLFLRPRHRWEDNAQVD